MRILIILLFLLSPILLRAEAPDSTVNCNDFFARLRARRELRIQAEAAKDWEGIKMLMEAGASRSAYKLAERRNYQILVDASQRGLIYRNLARRDLRLSSDWTKIDLSPRKVLAREIGSPGQREAIKDELWKPLTSLRIHGRPAEEKIPEYVAELLGKGSAFLESSRVEHEIIKEDGVTKIVILPTGASHLNRFARGLWEKVNKTRVVYDPHLLINNNFSAVFQNHSQGPNTLGLPHQSIYNLSAVNFDVKHELLHMVRDLERERGVERSTFGSATAMKDDFREREARPLPGAGKAYQGFLRFDELETYHLNIRHELTKLVKEARNNGYLLFGSLREEFTTSVEISERLSLILHDLEEAIAIYKKVPTAIRQWVTVTNNDPKAVIQLPRLSLGFFRGKNNQIFGQFVLNSSEGQYHVDIPLVQSGSVDEEGNIALIQKRIELLRQAQTDHDVMFKFGQGHLAEIENEKDPVRRLKMLEALNRLMAKRPFAGENAHTPQSKEKLEVRWIEALK